MGTNDIPVKEKQWKMQIDADKLYICAQLSSGQSAGSTHLALWSVLFEHRCVFTVSPLSHTLHVYFSVHPNRCLFYKSELQQISQVD